MRFSQLLIKLIGLCLALLIFAPNALALDPDTSSSQPALENSFTTNRNQTNVASSTRVANNESTLTAPVTDPKFNVMRKSEMLNSKAIVLVLSLLLIASIVPYVTWLVLRPR